MAVKLSVSYKTGSTVKNNNVLSSQLTTRCHDDLIITQYLHPTNHLYKESVLSHSNKANSLTNMEQNVFRSIPKFQFTLRKSDSFSKNMNNVIFTCVFENKRTGSRLQRMHGYIGGNSCH